MRSRKFVEYPQTLPKWVSRIDAPYLLVTDRVMDSCIYEGSLFLGKQREGMGLKGVYL